jgi:hypothetical protein
MKAKIVRRLSRIRFIYVTSLCLGNSRNVMPLFFAA